MPAEQGTENLSFVYDHRGPRPVNAIIENGRNVTEVMGFLVSCFSCVPHVTANERQFTQQIRSEALSGCTVEFSSGHPKPFSSFRYSKMLQPS